MCEGSLPPPVSYWKCNIRYISGPFFVPFLQGVALVHCIALAVNIKLLLFSSFFSACVGWCLTVHVGMGFCIWWWARKVFLVELLVFVSQIYPLWENKSSIDSLSWIQDGKVSLDWSAVTLHCCTITLHCCRQDTLVNKDISPCLLTDMFISSLTIL